MIEKLLLLPSRFKLNKCVTSAEDDVDLSETLLESREQMTTIRPSSNTRVLRVSFLLNLLLLLTCAIMLDRSRVTTCSSSVKYLRQFEDIYADVPSTLRYTSIHYDTDPKSSKRDFKVFWGRHWFEGSSREEIDKLWRDISSVQLISITGEEAKLLPYRTARNPDSPGTFAIVPQVFHDIHCLVRLGPSKMVYPTDYHHKNYVREYTLGRPSMHQESIEERLIHVDHCLGIIRQSIICEGNVQPVVFTKFGGLPRANPGAIPRTCRDWGTLWEWARQRNISSGSVEI